LDEEFTFRAILGVMSKENVDVVQSGFSALARGDFQSFYSVLDEGVEWVNPPYAVEAGTRRGTSEFRDALGRMRASFGDIQLTVDEVVEAGETVVVVTGRWTGEGAGSGVRLETPFSSALTLRDGKVVRYEWFREKAEALEAAALTPGSAPAARRPPPPRQEGQR
jgi:ketosteroid isomerase-like protein